MNTSTKVLGTAGILGTAGLGVNHFAPDVMAQVLEAGGSAMDIVGNAVTGAYEASSNGLGEVLASAHPMAGAAAPFALPMIAGGVLGKKLADVMKVEKKWKRVAMSSVGALAGAGLHASVLAPYITAGALASVLAKPTWEFAKGIGKYGTKITGGAYNGAIGGVVGSVKGLTGIITKPLGGLVNGVKKGYDNPSLKPQI